jgi:hypothetical protein
MPYAGQASAEWRASLAAFAMPQRKSSAGRQQERAADMLTPEGNKASVHIAAERRRIHEWDEKRQG